MRISAGCGIRDMDVDMNFVSWGSSGGERGDVNCEWSNRTSVDITCRLASSIIFIFL